MIQTSRDTNEKRSPSSRHLRYLLILFFLGIVVISVLISINPHSALQQTENTVYVDPHKAAIIDGLDDREPNSALIKNTMQCLSDAGYTVDIYSGNNVTIDLLQNIGGYKVLILRLHSVSWRGGLYLFSNEKYTKTDYTNEQLTGEVTQAATFDANEIHYFALNSGFLGKNKPDGMNGTTLILMGCDGMASQSSLQAFSGRGVQTYISWDGFVDLSHSDEASLRLVQAIYTEGMVPKAAVDKVNNEIGPDPFYKTKLICGLP